MVVSSYFGIAKRLLKSATTTLLSMRFDHDISVNPNSTSIALEDIVLKGDVAEFLRNERDAAVRYVVYLSRKDGKSRDVLNEEDLLAKVEASLRPAYRLIVLSGGVGYNSIELLHRSWQRFARVIAKARVIIGPHGGALNNLMWAPDDCDVIEFNEYPDDERYSTGSGMSVRRVFLHAFWAKGGNGRFWIVPPAVKSKEFYNEHMVIDPRDVLQVLQQIDAVASSKNASVVPLLKRTVKIDREDGSEMKLAQYLKTPGRQRSSTKESGNVGKKEKHSRTRKQNDIFIDNEKSKIRHIP